MTAAADVHDWEARGRHFSTPGGHMWALDAPAISDRGRDPLLVLHGFPSSSFDWRCVLDALRADRRVIAPDFLGFGLSDKPNTRYGIRMQADAVEAVIDELGLTSVAMVTHDMGNSVGGELLARSLDGDLDFAVTQRVLTNGSIYMEMAHLTQGQLLLLSLPDEPSTMINREGFVSGLAFTFSPYSDVSDEELEAQWLLVSRRDGHTLLPRTIRYIEDRRKEERRFTGAIETHPSPVGVVWGADDPVAVVAMIQTFNQARPNAPITILENVGHYPMIESPARTAAAITAYLRT
jgi:pimeloyl-ACP methyl ester carboxylesterase